MKKIFFCSFVIFFSFICLFIYNDFLHNHDFTDMYINNNNNNKIDNNFNNISILLETEYNSGIYESSTDTSWPKDYIFNSSLSKCKNGSEVSWDALNERVLVSGVSSDLCYAYFNFPKMINFTIDNTVYSANEGMTWSEWINSKYNTWGYQNVGKNGVILENSNIIVYDNSRSFWFSNSDVLSILPFTEFNISKLKNYNLMTKEAKKRILSVSDNGPSSFNSVSDVIDSAEISENRKYISERISSYNFSFKPLFMVIDDEDMAEKNEDGNYDITFYYAGLTSDITTINVLYYDIEGDLFNFSYVTEIDIQNKLLNFSIPANCVFLILFDIR